MKFKLSLTVVLLVFLAGALPCLAAEKPVGYMQSAQGTVEIAGQDGEVKIGAFDMAIMPQDVIKTGADSTAQVMFIDKTVLALSENTEVAIYDVYTPKKGGMFDMSFLSGTARIITSEILSDDPDKFRAMTPLGTIGIRGTELGLLADPGHEVVMLYEGGPAIYTDGQLPGVEDEEHAKLCSSLSTAMKKSLKAQEALKWGMDPLGKKKIKKQIAKIQAYQKQYHCAP